MPADLAMILVLVAPLGAAVLIVVSRSRPDVREGWTIVGASLMALSAGLLVPKVRAGEVLEVEFVELVDGVVLGLRADAAGVLFVVMASVLWLLTSSYSIGYVREVGEHRQTRFFACFAVCMFAVAGLAFARDLLTFFIFYELLTLATYPLVTHKDSDAALVAGRRYLAFLMSGGVALLVAIAFVYERTGSLGFVEGGFVSGSMTSTEIGVVFVLVAIGFGTKAAVMPLHSWLPAAMIAPTPVSALLHAVAVVKAGAFGFVRAIGFVVGTQVLTGMSVTAMLSVFAAATIVIASVMALRQDNLKRRLAYSTVAQLSYIVLGVSLLSQTAWEGGLYHLVNHAVLKITLFFCAGAIYVRAGFDRVSQLDGIGRRMPVTMAAFAVASLGLAGLPPMGGFVSKSLLVSATVEGAHPLYAAVFLTSSVLTVAYLFPIVYRAFFVVSPDAAGRVEAGPAMAVPIVATASIAVVLGLGDPFGLFDLVVQVSSSMGGAG